MRSRQAVLSLLLAAGLAATQAQNSDGFWTTAGGGSWASSGNWLDGTIADGTDNTAYFGISLFPVNSPATFTLDGARTIGNLNLTAQTTPANWLLNTGLGGPLTLDATFDFPFVQTGPGLQLTVNVVLAGDAGLEKQGSGTLVLAATNLYTGGTIVSGGTLLVNGRLDDTNMLTVAGGTLGGTGTISGPVTVQAGSVLSPGGSPGTLTISNTIILQSGSQTRIEVNAATSAHDLVRGITVVNHGGTLVVSNLAGSPTLGQSFFIFNTANFSGTFSNITPQLTGALRWRFDPAGGVVSVVTTNSQPKFFSLTLVARTNLVFSVTNGTPGATNYLLASTNLLLPRTSWSRLATNIFDASGNLMRSSAINPTVPQRYYLISVP